LTAMTQYQPRCHRGIGKSRGECSVVGILMDAGVGCETGCINSSTHLTYERKIELHFESEIITKPFDPSSIITIFHVISSLLIYHLKSKHNNIRFD